MSKEDERFEKWLDSVYPNWRSANTHIYNNVTGSQFIKLRRAGWDAALADFPALLASERERCCDAVRRADGIPSRGALNAEKLIHSLDPTNALEVERLKARIEEVKMWQSRCLPDYPPQPSKWGPQRIADLDRELREKEAGNGGK